MTITVLGICGSPVKGGNTEAFLKEALEAAADTPEVTTSMVRLNDKRIGDCVHCNWCITSQTPDRYCRLDDDMEAIYPELIRADVIMLATPVYFARLSGYMASFIDRLRCLYLGRVHAGKLVNKVGCALAVSWYRNRGVEPALVSIVGAFLGLQMLPVAPPKLGSPFGAAGTSSRHGTGEFEATDRVGVLKDHHGLEGARTMAKRAVAVARLIRSGA
ncbi:MAG: flavodoxin family protein [Dehalococcoidia bacterium]|nr:flavodoxin family protein [Dehalococcoidia bacterium]